MNYFRNNPFPFNTNNSIELYSWVIRYDAMIDKNKLLLNSKQPYLIPL